MESKHEGRKQRPFSVKVTAAALFLLVVGLGASRSDYLSAKRKFQNIERKQYRPGSRISVSTSELNAYVEAELPGVAPTGIRAPKVDLTGNNEATGRAMIDFLKLRSARGKAPNWFMQRLLQGEHEVAVSVHTRSSGGSMTVDLTRVEVSGVPIQGPALDFVVRNYLLPNYPNAKISKPFSLGDRVERIEVIPGSAQVVTR